MTYWILTCVRTGETMEIYTCARHAEQMPAADGDLVQAYDCDNDVCCEFCNQDRR
jgi:hypothetical protein